MLELLLGRRLPGAARPDALAPGHRVVFFPARSYPALVPDRASSAPGTLLVGLAAADLELLDRFEGEEYGRRAIEIIVSGTPARADVYWPRVKIPADAPDWRLADWTDRHKAAFLAAEARTIAELRRRPSGLQQ